MKRKNSFIVAKTAGLLLLASFVFVGCMKNTTNELPTLPPSEGDFSFETTQPVKLSIDYAAPGFQATFHLFDENPLKNPETGSLILKDGVDPIYTGITDKNGKFNREIIIPTAVKSVYLYTDRWGVRSCVKIDIVGRSASYPSPAVSKASTRAVSSASDLVGWFEGAAPYLISKGGIMSVDPEYLNTTKLYSTVKWTINGVLAGAGNTATDVFTTTTINENSVADISKRAQNYLATFKLGDDRKALLRDAKILNVTTKEDATNLNVVFLDEAALYNNVFGYYYYKVGNDPHNGKYESYSKEMRSNRNKYIIFPNVSKENAGLTVGTTVALKFYGETGSEIPGGTYDFPKGYVIGWFLNSQGFCTGKNQEWPKQYSVMDATFNNYDYDQWGNYITSDDQVSYNKSIDFRRFITLVDEKSKTLVIGVEDYVGKDSKPDDYCDLTFLVTSNKDITNSELPPIIEAPEEPIIDKSFKGTLAFEDVWPYGGDYDMNDVVVEYKWEMTINKEGYVSELKETYKPTHSGAALQDYFAYQLEMGTIQLSEGLVAEASTNSVRIENSVKNCVNQEFVLTRTFTTNVTRDELVLAFNPYIIVTDPKEPNLNQDRKEVHLPKKPSTSLANRSLVGTNDDAYYIDKNGKYAFAINIPVTGFKVTTELKSIDVEYPDFKLWSESKGVSNTDWYENYQSIKK